jgi:hypothetical protein
LDKVLQFFLHFLLFERGLTPAFFSM